MGHACDLRSAAGSAETTKERHRVFVVILSSHPHSADGTAKLKDIGYRGIGASFTPSSSVADYTRPILPFLDVAFKNHSQDIL